MLLFIMILYYMFWRLLYIPDDSQKEVETGSI